MRVYILHEPGEPKQACAADIVKGIIDGMVPGESCRIEAVEMSQEEMDSLPEY